MTDATIVIGIKGELSGGKRVQRTLDDIERSGAKATNSTKKLEKQFGGTARAGRQLTGVLNGLLGAFALTALQRIVDSYTNIQNRLKLVTSGTRELTAVTSELFSIANETRQTYESTAELYARTALATKELGLSQRDTLEFTRSLNQAVVLSGASAAEASAGIIQLSQGLASGALRGDELRSVLEQLPAVADVIAEHMGITRGQLREMGQEGAITAEIIIEAFAAARTELNDKFGKTVPTIAQAFVILKNNVTEYVGELDKASGVSAELAKFTIILANNIDKVVAGVLGALVVFATFKAAILGVGLASMTVGGGLGALVALLSGPAGLVIGLTSAAVAISIFSDELKATLSTTLDDAIFKVDELTSGMGELLLRIANYASAGGIGDIDEMVRIQNETRDAARNRRRASTERDIFARMESGRQNFDDLLGGDGTGGGLPKPPTVDLDAIKDAHKELKKIIKETSTEQETLIKKIRELETLKSFATTEEEIQAINRALEVANEQLKTASTTIPGMEDVIKDMERAMDRFAESTAEAFTDFITGAKSAKEAVKSLIDSLLNLVFEQTVTKPLSGLLSGVLQQGLGSVFGGIFGGGSAAAYARTSARGAADPGLFGPGFATGGSMVIGGNAGVDRNQLSLNGSPIARVGRGEVLSISPNQSGGGGGMTINQTLNISTGVQETVAAEFLSLLPEIQNATKQAIREEQSRGIS